MCNTSAIAPCHVSPFPPVKPSPLLAFCSLLLPLPAASAGFGELAVLSKIGEPLRAEVRIIATPEEKLDVSCFTIGKIRDPELPVISGARLALKNQSGQLLLRISGNSALNEPLATLRLNAACGFELQRDYIVMPMPPDSRIEQMDAPLPVSRLDQPPAKTPRREAKSASQSPSAEIRPASTKPAVSSDRLVLGTSPMLLDYTLPKTVSDETEERLLRMETSLARLNESLQSLDKALALGAEARAAEHELQLAIAMHDPPAAGPLPPEHGEPVWQKWLELILGTIAGGVLSAVALQWLSRLRPGYRDR